MFSTARRLKRFDYVVVGGGSAGCVVANRLSANPAHKVLLVEQGPYVDSDLLKAPGLCGFSNLTKLYSNWFETVPQAHLNNRKLLHPRGRVVGGSSTANVMLYVRGHKLDYDRWAASIGDDKFNYENVLPWFKKSQNALNYGHDDYVGRDGFLEVTKPPLEDLRSQPFCQAFINSGSKMLGKNELEDFNGPDQEGFGVYPCTVTDGMRNDTGRAFVRSVLEERPNLTVMDRSIVHSLTIDENKRVVGLHVGNGNRLKRSQKSEQITVDGELILCGGAFETPKILQMSGVGNKEALKSANIEMVHESPKVGTNLRDHLQIKMCYQDLQKTSNLDYTWKMLPWYLEWRKDPIKSARLGRIGCNMLPVGGFRKLNDQSEHPDVQHHILIVEVNDHARKPPMKWAFDDHLCMLRPESTGTVTVKSKNPFDHPVIDPNYFSIEKDLLDYAEAVRSSRNIWNDSIMKDTIGVEYHPGPNVQSDDHLHEHLRNNVETCYHPVGTCAIGGNEDDVVDAQFKVRGIDGLRIVDASVMPDLPSGNTNAPTIMLAEMCSHEILK